MKKRLLLLCVICLLLAGCAGSLPSAAAPEGDWAIGVLCTSGSRNQSSILYFNEDLEQVGVLHYPYATMGEIFYPPAVSNGMVYIIPQGQANRKDLKCILQQDLATFDHRLYSLDQIAIYSPSASSGILFTVSNLNGNSFLSRIDPKTGKSETAVFENRYFSTVLACQDTVYAFSSQPSASTLHCIDPLTLKEQRRIDLSHLGAGIFSAAVCGETLYFAPTETLSGGAPRVIGAYHLSSGTLDSIDCGQTAFHLLCAGDRLYLTHGNLVTGEGSLLSVYDPATGEQTMYDLGLWPAQIAVQGTSLYVLSRSGAAKFSLGTLQRQAQVSIPLAKHFYLSGIFANP